VRLYTPISLVLGLQFQVRITFLLCEPQTQAVSGMRPLA